MIELILTKGVLKPGAEHAIDLCAARGLPLAVASSSQYRLIDAALEHFGLRGPLRAGALGRGRGVRQAAPGRLPDRGGASWARRRAAASCGRTRRPACWRPRRPSMACIAVPEQGEGDHPAFGLADLVVDSLPEVDGAALDAVARRLPAGVPARS